MRIVGGKFKGRRFNPPVGKWPTRPTTDFAREALYNILNNRIDFEEVVFLDLFCGTGSHCFEIISRGCTDATCVDNYPGCIQFITKTAKELGIEANLKIIRADIFKFLISVRSSYNLIFADPPYGLSQMHTLPDLIFQSEILAQDGIFILEHGTENTFFNHVYFREERKYGDSVFSFFER